jgi:integrase
MPGAVSRDTWNQNRKIVELFADFAGSKEHVSVITRKVVRDWRAQLFHWPSKAVEMKAFRGKGFLAVIESNKSHKKPTISDTTINKYLSALGSFCTYLRGNDFIDEDVMGLYLKLDRTKKVVLPYTDGQLKKLFSSPLFHSCGGDKPEHELGGVECRDWRYWLPLIALYSGARLGEIAQLLIKDVRKIDEHWCFHICKHGDTRKSVKTAGSERVVPIHPELISLGLIDYHERLVSDGHISLFPEIEADTRGFMSGRPSKFFQNYFRAIELKVDKSVNCHSLRHGIADAFRRAGFLDEQFGMLLGHVKATTTQRYGILVQAILLAG